MFFFFFSSRRRHTRFDCDWSSDVCSSDLSWATKRLPHGLTAVNTVAKQLLSITAISVHEKKSKRKSLRRIEVVMHEQLSIRRPIARDTIGDAALIRAVGVDLVNTILSTEPAEKRDALSIARPNRILVFGPIVRDPHLVTAISIHPVERLCLKSPSGAALPPDVRRGFASPSLRINEGLCPRFGLLPQYSSAQGRTRGRAPCPSLSARRGKASPHIRRHSR